MPEAASWQELAGLLCACCPDLAALHLIGSGIDSAFVRALTLPRLSTLEVLVCVVDGLDAMMSAIGSLSSLEDLRLEEFQVGGVDYDVTPLASLSHLQRLSLVTDGYGSLIGLGTVQHSCPRLVLLRVSAANIPQGVELFNSSLKRLELAHVILSHGLPDVLSCFPSIQEVVVVGSFDLHDIALASEEEVAAAAHCIWQSCSVLSAWPVDNHGSDLILYGPSLNSLDLNLRLHAYTSLLHALAPLKGSSFVSSTTALQLRNFHFNDSGVMAALCDVFASVESLKIGWPGDCCSSLLVEAVAGLPQVRELRQFCGEFLHQSSVIAACVIAKGRRSGGRLEIKLCGVEPDEVSACQAEWAAVEPFAPGFCAVSIEALRLGE